MNSAATAYSEAPVVVPSASFVPARRPRARWLSRNLGGVIGLSIIAVVTLIALFAPFIATADPVKMNLLARLKPPTMSLTQLGAYPLGTDQLGRDIWSRIVYGSRFTLLISLGGVIVGGLLGTTVGLIAGYARGAADRVVMRIADVQLALPVLLLALMIMAVLGANAITLTIVLALTGWTRFARVVRGEVLSLRAREFVLSAEAAGARPLRIVARHILPNVLTPIVVVATLEMARLVLMESSLSFLGLGVQAPAPSWGRMLSEGRQYMESAWWLATLPGVMIVVVILGVSLVGDWLRDFYDPKLQGQR
jgi:peptide/nickel transport system permease protein